ncbi:MAG: glycosyltransferase [Clostridia bacterium]|nr:glycosyltransferase [Clostridia bacterium]
MPRVSVLMPAYNAERFAAAAVESVLRQTFGDFEIIAVDDGSTDGTAAVLARYPEVQLIRQRNAGISAARNRALEASVGEYIAFIDADDLWKPDKLRLQVAYLDAHPETEIVYSRFENFTEIAENERTPRQTELLEVLDEYHMTTALVRRRLFGRVGLFDPSLRFGEDTEWNIRVRLECPEGIAKTDAVTYLRRIHEENITLSHPNAGKKEMLILGVRAAMKLRNGKGKS